MRVLVTGATGFLGAKVLHELSRTNCEVTATSRNLGNRNETLSSRVRFVAHDFNSDRDDCYEVFDRPDSIIHLAWEGLPHYREMYHIERNVMRSYWFLKRMVESGVTDVAVVGTCLEYGLQNGCLGELLAPQPSIAYAIAKDVLRRFLEELSKTRNFSLKWIRLFYIYGGGENPSSLLGQLKKAMAEGEKAFQLSGGEQLRDYLPVEVAARYIVKIALQRGQSGTVNCCSGRPISIRKIVERAIAECGSTIEPRFGSLPYNDYEPMAFWGDVTRLKTIVGEEFVP